MSIYNNSASSARFVFHERVLKDQGALTKTALALAGFIMHQHVTSTGTSFRSSLREAERYLGIARSTLQRGRTLLEQRGHLIPIPEATGMPGRRNQAKRYFFGDGPQGMAAPGRQDGRSPAATKTVGFSEERSPKKERIPERRLPLMRVVGGER